MLIAPDWSSEAGELNLTRRAKYVVDNSRDSTGALVTWCDRTRRRWIDPFAVGYRCCGSSHQPSNRTKSRVSTRELV